MDTDSALKWYRQAGHDLEMGEKNISIGGYDVAAFLAQQAVEKILKAAIILKGKTLPRTHYLDELAQILQVPDRVLNAILDLTADYTFSRYPDVADHVPFEEYTEPIAFEKINNARVVFDYLKETFKNAGIA